MKSYLDSASASLKKIVKELHQRSLECENAGRPRPPKIWSLHCGTMSMANSHLFVKAVESVVDDEWMVRNGIMSGIYQPWAFIATPTYVLRCSLSGEAIVAIILITSTDKSIGDEGYSQVEPFGGKPVRCIYRRLPLQTEIWGSN